MPLLMPVSSSSSFPSQRTAARPEDCGVCPTTRRRTPSRASTCSRCLHTLPSLPCACCRLHTGPCAAPSTALARCRCAGAPAQALSPPQRCSACRTTLLTPCSSSALTTPTGTAPPALVEPAAAPALLLLLLPAAPKVRSCTRWCKLLWLLAVAAVAFNGCGLITDEPAPGAASAVLLLLRPFVLLLISSSSCSACAIKPACTNAVVHGPPLPNTASS